MASGSKPVGTRAPENDRAPDHLMVTFGYSKPPSQAARTPRNGTNNVWVIVYQTAMSLAPLGNFYYGQLAQQMSSGREPEVLGQGTEFSGFSTKHHLALMKLKSLNPQDLVILSDYADVLLNPGNSTNGAILREFEATFDDLTKDAPRDAVVVSAEAQCCVGALSYVRPGELVNQYWQRERRACNSGAPGCTGQDRDTREWQAFMEDLATHRGHRGTDYPYLNAGLMAGRAGDLTKLLIALNLEDDEDDQAVLTDLLYRSPGSFVLDYGQRLFGNARWRLGEQKGCVFHWDRNEHRFTQQSTRTYPLFIHTSGHYYNCLRRLARQLGWQGHSGSLRSGAWVSAVAAALSLLWSF